MPPSDKDPIKQRGRDMRRMGLALAIPSYFLAIPFIGYVLYLAAGKLFDKGGLGFVTGVVIGFVIAVRETSRILKQLDRDEKEKSGK